jgi:hypothetical protein
MECRLALSKILEKISKERFRSSGNEKGIEYSYCISVKNVLARNVQESQKIIKNPILLGVSNVNMSKMVWYKMSWTRVNLANWGVYIHAEGIVILSHIGKRK